MEKLKKALKAIAEGYNVQTVDDRYIVVENPDFYESSGYEPNLVIDVFEIERELNEK